MHRVSSPSACSEDSIPQVGQHPQSEFLVGLHLAIMEPHKTVVLEKQARYLLSIACLVKDAAKHDELQQKAQELLVRADTTRTLLKHPGPSLFRHCRLRHTNSTSLN